MPYIRVGLLQFATIGQLSSAQIRNAYKILDVISGNSTYKEEIANNSNSITIQE